jgi:hypothetical protein
LSLSVKEKSFPGISPGYILLETQMVDIGDLGDDREWWFVNLHGRTFTFDAAPTRFVKNGGIARIGMTIIDQIAGNAVEKKVTFQAENCADLSITATALKFSCEMLQLEKQLAEFNTTHIVS